MTIMSPLGNSNKNNINEPIKSSSGKKIIIMSPLSNSNGNKNNINEPIK